MRTEEYWIDVLDRYGNVTGQFQPQMGGTITAASDKTIVRSLTGMVLGPGDTLDTDSQLVRPVMSIDGVEEELGVFIPTLGARHRVDPELAGTLGLQPGIYTEINGHDFGELLDDTLPTAFGLDLGDNTAAGLAELMTFVGIADSDIPDLGDTLGTYLLWPPGTPISDARDALLRLLSLTGRILRTGTFSPRTLPFIGVDAPVKAWHAGEASELAPDASEVFNNRTVPNKWWVVSTTEGVTYAGTYELPNDHPRSFVSTGRRKTITMEVSGLTSTAACEQRARDEALRDPNVHDTVDLTCAVDPTLEPLDIVTYLDRDWILDSFVIEMTVGTDMKARLRESLVATT